MSNEKIYRMTRKVYTFIFAFILNTFNLFAQEYSAGSIFEKDGISYKVLVSYLVVDSKESPDTVKGPDKFYQAGELMVIKVDEGLNDVVIPPAVGRFKVVGLTDSLFFEHEHDRIWLPDLAFAGNGCFAKLKMRSGALVIHDITNLGESVFDNLDADLIFEVTKPINCKMAFQKRQDDSTLVPSKNNGIIKVSSDKLGLIDHTYIYDNSYSTSGVRYKAWVDKAFNNDDEFKKNALKDKYAYQNKKSYSTTPRNNPKGFNITANVVNVKKIKFPWGTLTNDYLRECQYRVDNKKKKRKGPNTVIYDDFIPVADATLKEGWYVKFVDLEGGKEVKYKLNGKLIK